MQLDIAQRLDIENWDYLVSSQVQGNLHTKMMAVNDVGDEDVVC